MISRLLLLFALLAQLAGAAVQAQTAPAASASSAVPAHVDSREDCTPLGGAWLVGRQSNQIEGCYEMVERGRVAGDICKR